MNPDTLLCRVAEEAAALGIPISRNLEAQVRVNTRAKTRFGCCILRGGRYVIEISSRLLHAPESALRQTLAHELLHTCPGCRNHGVKWKQYAAQMQAAYGYAIARTDTCQHLGVAAPQARYRVTCRACGAVSERFRRSKLVAHPERYRCRCGGRLSVERAQPPE